MAVSVFWCEFRKYYFDLTRNNLKGRQKLFAKNKQQTYFYDRS